MLVSSLVLAEDFSDLAWAWVMAMEARDMVLAMEELTEAEGMATHLWVLATGIEAMVMLVLPLLLAMARVTDTLQSLSLESPMARVCTDLAMDMVRAGDTDSAMVLVSARKDTIERLCTLLF